MLEKIHTLTNVGLFESGTPSPVAFERATLIYAENGRGKSTLSAVFRAASENDATAVLARRTLDATGAPRIGMQISGQSVKFESNTWTQPSPDFVVFDSEFVERNVYSGSEIRPDQRQSLLEFALGDAAVSLKRDVERIAAGITEANRGKATAEGQLTGFRRGMALREFRDLPANPDCDQEIDILNNQIATARQQQAILMRPDPAAIPQIRPDLTQFLEVLASSLEGIEESAEAKVRAHLSKHAAGGVESWVSHGQRFITEGECPFCGQNIDGIELIRAYRVHFNTAYNDLKERVKGLGSLIDAQISPNVGQSMQAKEVLNQERISAWGDQLQLITPTLNVAELTQQIELMRKDLFDLAAIKSNSPLAPVDEESKIGDVRRREEVLNLVLENYNTQIKLICDTIAGFKRSLADSNILSLETKLKQLELQKVRHTDAVVRLVEEIDVAEQTKNRLEQEKATVREQLDSLMETTLGSLMTEINKWLLKFGASFSIEELKPDYQGGGLPRSKYGIKIRGKVVALGTRGSSGPVFANTLSEGDKRSLAFSFFLSRLGQRQDLDRLIVVVDDPVTSLDRNRRAKTKDALAQVSKVSKQIIILAHDAFFLRDQERLIREKAKVQTKVLEVRRAPGEYSVISDCDLEDVCLSDYHQHYLCVHEFVEAQPSADARKAAMALRTLVEGHLHRRFPSHLKPGVMLGKLITAIENSTPPNPMVALQSQVEELRAFNGFASKYHHDTNPSPESEPISETELITYCKQGLQLIHTGAF